MSKLPSMLADEYNWYAMEEIQKHAKFSVRLLMEEALRNPDDKSIKAFKAFAALSDAIETINKLRSE